MILSSWHIAEAICADCEHDAPQGLLYSETATTLLALQVIRGLSNRGDAVKVHHRGGLSPAVLRRACEYMVSRIGEDIALREVASVCSLSPGHFAVAFKQSAGLCRMRGCAVDELTGQSAAARSGPEPALRCAVCRVRNPERVRCRVQEGKRDRRRRCGGGFINPEPPFTSHFSFSSPCKRNRGPHPRPWNILYISGRRFEPAIYDGHAHSSKTSMIVARPR